MRCSVYKCPGTCSIAGHISGTRGTTLPNSIVPRLAIPLRRVVITKLAEAAQGRSRPQCAAVCTSAYVHVTLQETFRALEAQSFPILLFQGLNTTKESCYKQICLSRTRPQQAAMRCSVYKCLCTCNIEGDISGTRGTTLPNFIVPRFAIPPRRVVITKLA